MDFTKIRLFLFDMDGTLYLGDELFPFTKPLLETIRSAGKTYLFMTNNSSKSVLDYVAKMERLGISAEYDDFITSSQATADYLMKNHRDVKFYVCGTESFKAELAAVGVRVCDVYSEDIGGVVMGYDTELTYRKLGDVSKLLTLHDIPYIAANPDFVCPTEYGLCAGLRLRLRYDLQCDGEESPLYRQAASRDAACPRWSGFGKRIRRWNAARRLSSATGCIRISHAASPPGFIPCLC